MNSLKCLTQEIKPSIVIIVETHLQESDSIEIGGYQVKRNDRDKFGGGIMICVKDTLKNIVTEVYKTVKEKYEGLWIVIDNGVAKVKIGAVYLPQEGTRNSVLENVYNDIEREMMLHKMDTIIFGDFNARLEREDQEQTESNSGKIMRKFVERNQLRVGNHEPIAEGRWTRVEGNKKIRNRLYSLQ